MSSKYNILKGPADSFREGMAAAGFGQASKHSRIEMRKQGRRGGALSRRVWGFLLCIFLFVSLLPAPDASAASLRLYYPDTNKTEIYKGTLVTYNYNDTVLSLNGLKGILTDNGVALGPHYELFAEQLGVSCTEDSAKNTLTFRRGSNTLVLTPNSKTAVLNGKKVTMNAAPVRVCFSDLNITRIMVPTRFVAESLGYDYKWDSSIATVTIRNRMTLSYNNKVSSYIGTTGKVTLDSTAIDVSDFPTILINNTAMLRAYSVFDQAMGVSYSYNQNTGAIVFSKGALTLQMQENSTTAYLNGARADCGVAPVNVTYQETGMTALLVPGRFVAESLGYDYTWNSAAKVSEIRTTSMVGVDVSSGAESGKPEAPQEITAYSFVVDETKYLEYENIINNTVTSIRTDAAMYYSSYIDRIYQDTSTGLFDSYVIRLGSPVTKVDSFLDAGKLVVTLENTVCQERIWPNFGGNLVNAIQQTFDSGELSARLIFELTEELPYYNLALSDDGMSLMVDVYPNYLLGLETGTDRSGSYLRFRGIYPFTYETVQEDGYEAVYFKNTCNTLGNIVFPDEIFSDYFDYALMLEPEPDTVKLLYKPARGVSLAIAEGSNDFYLYFNYEGDGGENSGVEKEPADTDGISVPLPSGVSFSKVSAEDQYWNQKIIFTLPGEYEQFYQNHPVSSPYSVVDDITVSQNSGKTQIVLSTSRIQGFSMKKSADGFIVQLGNPSEIYSKIVVLDAGHGGIDPGASAGGYNEKDINFTILNQYTKEYFDNSDIKIYFTRTTDTKIDLYERASFASRVEADLFISLHMNANDSSSINGTSVYYSTLNTSVANGLTSRMMAAEFTDRLSAALGTRNRGVIAQNFVVVKETRMPAVLIELAFITNAGDRKLITTPATQKKAAKTIYETVEELFKKYPTGR